MSLVTAVLFLKLDLTFGDTTMLFFGGDGFNQEQSECWENGTKNYPNYKDIKFRAFKYPAQAKHVAASAVAMGQNTISEVVAEINSHPTQKFVIVGHSSGTSIANEVARLVKDPKQIELINLDGYIASADLQKRVKYSCVFAEGRTGLLSMAVKYIKNSCTTIQKYADDHCDTQWCLHFSLVNKKSPSNLGKDDFAKKGYDGCATNLDWFNRSDLTQGQIPKAIKKTTTDQNPL